MNKNEKIIYETIKNYGKIRWRKLQIIIVEEMSKTTFRLVLRSMVEKGIVFRNKVSDQNIEYYVDKEIEDIEKNALEFFDYNLPEAKRLIEHIEKNRSKIPKEDLAGYITVLWKVVNHLEYKGEIMSIITNNLKLSKRQECEKIRLMLIKLIYDSKSVDEMYDLFLLTDGYLQYETFESIRILKDDLHAKDLTWIPKEIKSTS